MAKIVRVLHTIDHPTIKHLLEQVGPVEGYKKVADLSHPHLYTVFAILAADFSTEEEDLPRLVDTPGGLIFKVYRLLPPRHFKQQVMSPPYPINQHSSSQRKLKGPPI